MFSNVKISNWQILSLLLVSRAFNALNYVPMFSDIKDMSVLLVGNIIALAVQLILIIPAIIMFNKHKSMDILSVSIEWCKPFGICISILFLLFILLNIVGTIVGLEFYLANAVYPDASSVMIVLTLCIACFVVSQSGIEGIARASTIVFVVLVIGITFIGVSSIESIDMLNVRPISDNTNNLYKATTHIITKNSEIWLLLLLNTTLKAGFKKVSIWFLIISSCFIEIVNFLVISVLGPFAYNQVFPYFTLASIAETSVIQRFDSIHMIIWVCVSFIKITFYAIVAGRVLNLILPKKAKKLSLLSLYIFTASISIFLSAHPEWLSEATPSFPFIMLITTVLIPIILCFKRKVCRR